jgi:ppGpp synthetase/RelA/SpoT-type nucleotidyltranferase
MEPDHNPDHEVRGSMNVISSFLDQYEREYDFYFQLAQLTARRCEVALSDAGIRHLPTFRAKRPDRLQQKLIKRHEAKPYTSVNSIRDDIVDLSGVRIALFFPGDRPRAAALVEEIFEVEPEGRKDFPTNDGGTPNETYTKRFPGYCATHLRVSNRSSDLNMEDQRYAGARVEIQIASVLMLAWQEVEHDLAYKPLSGSLSEDEMAILDEVNGMVIAGEIAFERLQKAVQRRLDEPNQPFANHYELASYIYNKVGDMKSSEEQP